MTHLLSFRQYAARTGLNASSISRAVAKGHIPVVTVEGKRFINPAAADAARAERRSPAGGSAETRAAAAARWRARVGCGFDLGQLRLLGVLTAHGPRLLASGMRSVGATDEIEIARAAAVMGELIGYAACCVHNEFNRRGFNDYRKVLPETIEPPFKRDEARDTFRRLSRPDDFADIDPDMDIWPDDWTTDLFSSFAPAQL